VVNEITIAGRTVGPQRRCFIIAEAGVNHNGDLQLAKHLVRIAAECGADAVKFQTFRADSLALEGAPKAEYQKTSENEESQHAMLRRLELSEDDHRELISLSKSERIAFISSPFDEASAEFLYELQVPAMKVPSGEITNLPFLRKIGAMGIPVIMSTGMSNLDEVRRGVAAIRQTGSPPLALLHCVSNYPAEAPHCNLRAMATMESEFQVPVGFSDHTLGGSVVLAAVALGACIVEKHFTTDKSLPGPDHKASLDPNELREYVRGIRMIESSLGDGIKIPANSELEVARVARKSLVAATDIPIGSQIDASMLIALRPGTGISPANMDEILGLRALKLISKGTLISREALS
jgi:N,N'-diacetyllegionaminate synthase